MNPNSGIGLVDRADVLPDANLEAFVPHGPVAQDMCWHEPRIDTVHVPHADAEVAPTSGRPIADFNDYPVLAAYLCPSLANPNVTCAAGQLAQGPLRPVVCHGGP